jgi:hypothetical protein
MADGSASDRPRGGKADQILIASLICVATSRIESREQERAIDMIAMYLPLASTSPRIEALRDAAEGILAAWPLRRRRGEGALAWARANMDLSAAVARDAFRAALARMEAA